METTRDFQIDNIDLQILSLLLKDAQMPYTEIARQVHVSGPTVHVRMKRLEQLGVIKGAQMVIDYTKLGYDISAFIGIFLKESKLYESVIEHLIQIPEVLSINYTTGNYSIFIKIICKDTRQLMDLLHQRIQKIEGIERTETFISLHEPINRPLLW